ncbi:MAG: hypothetical protein SPI77_01235 [Corynebacterium sp.]|nr:hypothetical protein [Corynebacterium sp.]
MQRDLVVVNHPALSVWNFGTALAPRNAPQDGVLALVGLVAPASWVVRLIVVGCLIWGLVYVWRAIPVLVPRVAAMVLVAWNPFVAERLAQGHWALVCTWWLLPVVMGTGRWSMVAQWLASLTPTGACAAAVASRRWGFGLVVSLPWLIPSLIMRPVASASEAFAPRRNVWDILGLGGIWNSAVTPGSRLSAWSLAAGVGMAVCVAVILASRPRHHRWALVCALLGLVVALITAFVPLGWVYSHVPGAGLLRDGSKWLVLVSPALVAACRTLESLPWGRIGAAVLTVLALASVPDLPSHLRVLAPVAEDPGWYSARGPAPMIVTIGGHVALNPVFKAADVAPEGPLRVGGTPADPAVIPPVSSSWEQPWRWWLGLGLSVQFLMCGAQAAVASGHRCAPTRR